MPQLINTSELAAAHRLNRGNPIAGLVPASLTQAINDFDTGFPRKLALIYERLEMGADPQIMVNARKRRESVASLPWEITVADELSPREQTEAERHRETLLHTFNNLTVLNAIEPEEEGEVSALVDNLMRAEFLRYAVHEKIFTPRGRDLDLSLVSVPISCFENSTGPLKYTGPLGLTGLFPLDREGFLVAKRSTLAIGLSVCWMFGSQTLKDWLEFNAGFMLPGVHGKCSGAINSEAWQQLKSALDGMIAQWVLITGKDEEVDIVKADATGGIAAQPLYEIMQRMKITLCLGSDLSTESRHNSQGASLQATDTAARIASDARFVEDVINRGLVRQIIRYVFGNTVQPLAWFKLRPPMDRDDALELQKDKFLIEQGVPYSIAQLAEKYGHSLPGDGEELVNPSAPAKAADATTPPAPAADAQATDQLRNEAATAKTDTTLRDAVRADLQPLRELIAAALQRDGKTINADEWDAVTEALMNDGELEQALNAEWFTALIEASGGTREQALAMIKEATQPKTTKTP